MAHQTSLRRGAARSLSRSARARRVSARARCGGARGRARRPRARSATTSSTRRAGGRGRRSAPRRPRSRGAARGRSARPGRRSRASGRVGEVERRERLRAEALEAAGEVAHADARARGARTRRAAAADRARRTSAPVGDPAARRRSASRARGRRRRAPRASSRARSAGSCEKSASISITEPAPASSAWREAGEVGGAEAALARRRCSTSTSPGCSAASRSAIAPVPSGEPSSTTRIRKPSGAAAAQHAARRR